jgi:hypothetical protein
VRRLHILCEGQTEEIIARDVIEPHFTSADSYVTLSIFTTKRPAGGPAFKGGLSNWPKLERELRLFLRDRSITMLTTIFDYYAFPADAPGMADRPRGSPYDRVRHVESALAKALGDTRFLPNLVLHETEAWVLAACDRLGALMGDPGPATELERIVRLGYGPELVNDGVNTAPSKRILNAYPQYTKTGHGPLVIMDAGLDSIRGSCPHADEWLREIEARLSRLVTRLPGNTAPSNKCTAPVKRAN